MRKLLQIVDVCLPFAGIACILGAMILARESPRCQIAVVGLGMVLIELGVWKVARRLTPDGRRYKALRAEGDRFLGLIRELNSAAVALIQSDSEANRRAVGLVQAHMRQAIDRMAFVAGRTDAEIATLRESERKKVPDQTEPSESVTC